MQQAIIDSLVKEILRRLRQQVWVIVTAADGYKEIIHARLKENRELTFSVFIDKNAQHMHANKFWGELGPLLELNEIMATGAFEKPSQLFLPFLDFATLAELANGLFYSESAKIIHHALMNNKQVWALDYNCRMDSEINRIKGLNRGKNLLQFKEHIARIQTMGICFCSLDSFLEQKKEKQSSQKTASSYNSYLTLNELIKNNGHCPEGVKLTALAQDYLREKNIINKSQ